MVGRSACLLLTLSSSTTTTSGSLFLLTLERQPQQRRRVVGCRSLGQVIRGSQIVSVSGLFARRTGLSPGLRCVRRPS